MQPYDLLAQDFFKSSMMGFKRLVQYQCNVSQLIQQIPFWWKGPSPIWASTMQPYLMICSLRFFFLKCCCKKEHNSHTKVIVNFLRKYILGKMGNLGPI